MLTEPASFECPWCGEHNVVELDPEEAGQVLVQDCGVCCRPVELQIATDGRVTAGRESG